MTSNLNIDESITPVFTQNEANEPIHILVLRCLISKNNEDDGINVNLSFEFTFGLKPELKLKCDDKKLFPLMTYTETVYIKIIDKHWKQKNDSSFNVIIEKVVINNNSTSFTFVLCNGFIDLIKNTEKSSEISTVKFHLLNFPNFYGNSPAKINNKAESVTRNNFKFCYKQVVSPEKWLLRLQAINGQGELKKSIEESGGFRLTHCGELTKQENKTIDHDEVITELDNLRYFLSFKRTTMTSPLLICGYNSTKELVWLRLGTPFYLTNSYDNYTWSPIAKDKEFTKLHYNLILYLRNEKWGKIIRNVIYLLCLSNQKLDGVYNVTKLMFTQSALEAICDAVINLNIPIKLTKQIDFSIIAKETNISQKIEKLLKCCDVPTTTPSNMFSDLNKTRDLPTNFYKNEKRSIPSLTSAIRNDFTHANKTIELIGHAESEALFWSTWAIELVLLRLLNYNGAFHDRRVSVAWAGDVHTVPWATTTEASE